MSKSQLELHISEEIPEIWERVAPLTKESRKAYFDRVQRLLDEGWDEDRALHFAAGLAPYPRQKWPPKLAYRTIPFVKAGLNKYEAESRVRRWFDQWFWRNHEFA